MHFIHLLNAHDSHSYRRMSISREQCRCRQPYISLLLVSQNVNLKGTMLLPSAMYITSTHIVECRSHGDIVVAVSHAICSRRGTESAAKVRERNIVFKSCSVDVECRYRSNRDDFGHGPLSSLVSKSMVRHVEEGSLESFSA